MILYFNDICVRYIFAIKKLKLQKLNQNAILVSSPELIMLLNEILLKFSIKHIEKKTEKNSRIKHSYSSDNPMIAKPSPVDFPASQNLISAP